MADKINKSIIASDNSSIVDASIGNITVKQKISFFLSGFLSGIISSVIANYIWSSLR